MKDTTSTKENFDEFDEFSDEFMDEDNQPSKMSSEQINDRLNELFENFGTKQGEKTAKKSKSSALLLKFTVFSSKISRNTLPSLVAPGSKLKIASLNLAFKSSI